MDGLGDDETDALLDPAPPAVVAQGRIVDAQPSAEGGKAMSYGPTEEGGSGS